MKIIKQGDISSEDRALTGSVYEVGHNVFNTGKCKGLCG